MKHEAIGGALTQLFADLSTEGFPLGENFLRIFTDNQKSERRSRQTDRAFEPMTNFSAIVNQQSTKMFRRLLALSLVSSISAVSTATIAAPTMPKPNRYGEYYSVREARRWTVVVSDGLNCRSGPGTNYSVVEVKPEGQTLDLASEHFGGGPPYLDLDDRGSFWLKVNGGYESYCFVRANSRFIQPIPGRY